MCCCVTLKILGRKINPTGKLMWRRGCKRQVEVMRKIWGGWEAVEEREMSFWLLPKQMVGLTKRWWLARVCGEAWLCAAVHAAYGIRSRNVIVGIRSGTGNLLKAGSRSLGANLCSLLVPWLLHFQNIPHKAWAKAFLVDQWASRDKIILM